MAGVKGRSGGSRPGAGRKPAPKTHNMGAAAPAKPVKATIAKPKQIAKAKPVPVPPVPPTQPVEQPALVADGEISPLEFLLAAMRNPGLDDKLRLEAAKTAALYIHPKKGDVGVKDEKAEKAKKAGSGKFGAAAPPKLIVNNGR